MSWHGLVSAHTSNVYNSHATLNALAYIVCVKQFVMSLPAISLGDWFSVSRKGRWVGIYTQRAKTTLLCVVLAEKNPSVGSLSLYKWSRKTVISPHRASMHAVFKCDLFASIA